MNVAVPAATAPSVGACIDMINALSDESRQQLFQLLNVAPVLPGNTSDGVNVPAGYTRDPTSGRVFRQQAPKARTVERVALEEAVQAASAALRSHARNLAIQPPAEGEDVVFPAAVSQRDRTEYETRVAALVAAKAALAAYKTQHPAEFAPTPRGRGNGRGGRGRRGGRLAGAPLAGH